MILRVAVDVVDVVVLVDEVSVKRSLYMFLIVVVDIVRKKSSNSCS